MSSVTGTVIRFSNARTSIDVTLDEDDVRAIDGLNKDERTGPDPATFHHEG